jgi:GT2 family glycosyltransferase
MDDVTVVIPTHGRDEMLRRALASVLAQDLLPAHVIVSDDLASAQTRTVVEDTAAGTSACVTYLDCSGRAGTAGASRNAGAAQAATTWLAFLDDDDAWRADFLSSCLGRAREDSAQLAVAWVEPDDPSEQVARIRPGLEAQDVLTVNPGFLGSNVLYRRETFVEVGGFDPDLLVSEDKDLLLRLLASGATYAVVEDTPVLRTSGHGSGQLTVERTARRREAVLRYRAKHADLITWRHRPYFAAALASIDRVLAPSAVGRAWATGALVLWRTVHRLVGHPR